MLRDAKHTVLPNSIEVRWYFVALVTAAIAISYFDRQTLARRDLGDSSERYPSAINSFRGCSLRS